jgi:hypothetical protein
METIRNCTTPPVQPCAAEVAPADAFWHAVEVGDLHAMYSALGLREKELRADVARLAKYVAEWEAAGLPREEAVECVLDTQIAHPLGVCKGKCLPARENPNRARIACEMVPEALRAAPRWAMAELSWKSEDALQRAARHDTWCREQGYRDRVRQRFHVGRTEEGYTLVMEVAQVRGARWRGAGLRAYPPARATDSSTWATFDEAWAQYLAGVCNTLVFARNGRWVRVVGDPVYAAAAAVLARVLVPPQEEVRRNGRGTNGNPMNTAEEEAWRAAWAAWRHAVGAPTGTSGEDGDSDAR